MAIAGEAERRWSSSYQAICSGLPSGRKCIVNSRRKAGFVGEPDPVRGDAEADLLVQTAPSLPRPGVASTEAVVD
jgi:hypothetical protein